MRSDVVKATATILFLLGQCFAVAHGAEFGHEAHEHDGVVCLAMLNDEQDALAPLADQCAAVFIAWQSASVAVAVEPAKYRLHTIRPPATGPPRS